MIGINTGNAKLKTPQISHALAVFPSNCTATRSDVTCCSCKDQNGSKEPQLEGRPRQKDDWPQSNGSKRFPLHSHLWLPQPKPAAVHGNMFEGPAKELDKDWDALWFHTPKRSFKTLSVIFFGFTRLQPFDMSSHGCSLLQDLIFIV